MQVGEISSLYLPDTSEDIVVQQDPAPGTTDAATPHENFLVSLGPRPPAYVMPDLVGLSLDGAMSKLNSAGLKIAKIATSPVPGAPSNQVVGEIPARGRLVDGNTAITLQIAQ
jgi:beta-lactam-binding protein with PASTA domain